MSEDTLSKEQLLQGMVSAFEQIIETATHAAQRSTTRQGDAWGPREIVAHLAGWEIMATVRIPKIAAGMPPLDFDNDTQQNVMNDAINAAIVTMIGEQPLETLCGLLRQAYQRDVEMMQQLREACFQPGQYVYERAKNVIEHCQEHRHDLLHLTPDGVC